MKLDKFPPDLRIHSRHTSVTWQRQLVAYHRATLPFPFSSRLQYYLEHQGIDQKLYFQTSLLTMVDHVTKCWSHDQTESWDDSKKTFSWELDQRGWILCAPLSFWSSKANTPSAILGCEVPRRTLGWKKAGMIMGNLEPEQANSGWPPSGILVREKEIHDFCKATVIWGASFPYS